MRYELIDGKFYDNKEGVYLAKCTILSKLNYLTRKEASEEHD